MNRRNDVKWVPCSARFALLGGHSRGTGALQVYSLNHGKLDCLVDTEKQHSFKCGTFGASSLEDRHFATGDFEGRLAVWNLEHVDLPVFSVKAHQGMINCVDGCGGLGVEQGLRRLGRAARCGDTLEVVLRRTTGNLLTDVGSS